MFETGAEDEILARAVVAGLATGLRSQAPFPTLARAARAGRFGSNEGAPLGWLRSEPLGRLIAFSAAGEMVVDKLPFTPARIARQPLAGRLMFGALAGGAIGKEAGSGWSRGTACGAVGALAGSYAGYWVRKTVVDRTPLPDFIVALLEDAVALGLARTIVSD